MKDVTNKESINIPEDRYLINTHTKEIHDLYHEKHEASGCQTDEIILSKHAKKLSKEDNLDKLIREQGYSHCAKCFSKESSEK